MITPGTYNLVTVGITTAQTAEAYTAITGLDGMTAVTLIANLAYGSGGTTAAAVVQTSADGGTVWRDIARFNFTTASATKYSNNSGLTAKGVTAYADLSTEGVNDGILGTQLRAVLTTTGTYADSTMMTVLAVCR